MQEQKGTSTATQPTEQCQLGWSHFPNKSMEVFGMPQTSAVNAYMVKWIRQAAVCSTGIAKNAITYHVLSPTVLRNNHAMPTLLDDFCKPAEVHTASANIICSHFARAAGPPTCLSLFHTCAKGMHGIWLLPAVHALNPRHPHLQSQSLSSSSKSLMTVR